ncbi:MAG: tetratricopeptide repeat protein [Treponema sp.]|nr:tetratricopeptide repeat protein [Treponema sp.]
MKRKSYFTLLVISVFAAVILASCGTTKEVSPKEEVTKESPKEEKKETPKKEPDEPADVRFARKLQEYLDRNDLRGAIAFFAQMPKELEDKIDLKLLLGALYYSDAQYDNAVDVANGVLAIDANNIDAMELLSMCARAKGDKNAYKAAADKILLVDPYNASVNIQKAEDYALNKRYKLALNSYRNALKGDANNTDALFGFAQMSYFLDDDKTAENYLNKVLVLDPKNAPALAYLAKIAYGEENYYRATKLIKQAIEIDSNTYDFWMDYGTYLRYQGKFEEAAKCWEKAVTLDPSYFLAYAYLAGNYDDLGKFDLALENYHKVIETNPKYFYAYESTAILEYHAGNYKNAVAYFSKANSYSSNYSYALMIAASYMKMNDSLNAKKILAAQLKNMEKGSVEYDMVRFFYDTYSRNAEASLKQKIDKELNSNKRGKMLFYMGLYYELMGANEMAVEYYAKVTSMSAPMFFEFRIAEWGMKNESNS